MAPRRYRGPPASGRDAEEKRCRHAANDPCTRWSVPTCTTRSAPGGSSRETKFRPNRSSWSGTRSAAPPCAGLRDLETLGIVRQPGRGSFVSQPAVETRLDRLTGFVEDMEALGLTATASVELVETVPAPDRAAEALRCAVGEPVVHIQRVRLANGTPISFDDSYFVQSLGTRIARENLRDEPFYSILEQKYRTWRGPVLRATLADRRVAGHLHIAPGTRCS